MWAWHRHSSASTERKREDRDMRKCDRRAHWLMWNGERMDGNNTKVQRCLLEHSIQKLLSLLSVFYAVEACHANEVYSQKLTSFYVCPLQTQRNVTSSWKKGSFSETVLSLFKKWYITFLQGTEDWGAEALQIWELQRTGQTLKLSIREKERDTTHAHVCLHCLQNFTGGIQGP